MRKCKPHPKAIGLFTSKMSPSKLCLSGPDPVNPHALRVILFSIAYYATEQPNAAQPLTFL